MITARVPHRISLLGGGTDLIAYSKLHGGHVVSMAINKYVYVSVKKHGEFFNERIRLNYSQTETVNEIDEIKNKIIKACLSFLNVKDPLYISTISDLPSGSGLGSSSAFTVGLLQCLHQYLGQSTVPLQLAEEASFIEIDS